MVGVDITICTLGILGGSTINSNILAHRTTRVGLAIGAITIMTLATIGIAAASEIAIDIGAGGIFVAWAHAAIAEITLIHVGTSIGAFWGSITLIARQA